MHHLLERLFFPPLNFLGTLVENHLTIYAKVYLGAFILLSTGLIYVSLYTSATLILIAVAL